MKKQNILQKKCAFFVFIFKMYAFLPKCTLVYPLFCLFWCRQTEQFSTIRRCYLNHFLRCTVVNLCQPHRYKLHQQRFIPFTAMRRWRELRTIGLQQQPLQRHILKVLCQLAVLECQHSAYSQVQSHIQPLLSYLCATAETMNYTPDC